MKLKFFYRVNVKGEPVLGSNIRRYKKPRLNGKWKNLPKPCCSPNEVECNCNADFKFFVQIDEQNNPIDYTLIKRFSKPRREGIRFAEVPLSLCCEETPPSGPNTLSITVLSNITPDTIEITSISGLPSGNLSFRPPITSTSPGLLTIPNGTYTVTLTTVDVPDGTIVHLGSDSGGCGIVGDSATVINNMFSFTIEACGGDELTVVLDTTANTEG